MKRILLILLMLSGLTGWSQTTNYSDNLVVSNLVVLQQTIPGWSGGESVFNGYGIQINSPVNPYIEFQQAGAFSLPPLGPAYLQYGQNATYPGGPTFNGFNFTDFVLMSSGAEIFGGDTTIGLPSSRNNLFVYGNIQALGYVIGATNILWQTNIVWATNAFFAMMATNAPDGNPLISTNEFLNALGALGLASTQTVIAPNGAISQQVFSKGLLQSVSTPTNGNFMLYENPTVFAAGGDMVFEKGGRMKFTPAHVASGMNMQFEKGGNMLFSGGTSKIQYE